MSASQPARKRLPVKPSSEHLRKQAKRLARDHQLPLADAQHRLAGEYGARSWADLMHIVETMLRGADQLFGVKYEMEALPRAANANDLERVRAILASGAFTQHDLDLALARSVLRFDHRGEIARLLLEHGADPDGQYGSNYGPIIFVTGECLDVEGLKFLIAAGADVTFEPIDTKYGRQCPLSYWLGTYVRGRNAQKHEGIEILLQHGAYVPPEITPSLLAIHRGDTTALAQLIEADRDLPTRTIPGELPYTSLTDATLLHYACEFGEDAIIDLLIAAGADINAKSHDGTTPIALLAGSWAGVHHPLLERILAGHGDRIDLAAEFGDPKRTVREKVEINARIDRSSSHKGFYKRAADDMRVLDSAGAPPVRWETVLAELIKQNAVNAVSELLDERPDLLTPALWPPVIFRARSIELTRLLLDRGLDPNVCAAPRKPLHLAADRGLVEIVKLLIERGARLDVVDGQNITPYELVNTPLVSTESAEQIRQILRTAGASDTIFTLINRGEEAAAIRRLRADPSLRDAVGPLFFTPLHAAARAGAVDLVRLLLEMKAPVDQFNNAGNTALWLACQSDADPRRRIAIAQALLEAGANPRRACEERSTPLHYAAWRGPREMVELLIRHNAKTWLRDAQNRLPIDYARQGTSTDRDAIVHLLDRPVIDDPHFRAAVKAIHAGALATLRQLLIDHPDLSRARAIEPDCYPQSDYFGSPKLLWFVANNPTLIETMPRNIVEIADAIIAAGVAREDLQYTLELVMTSDPAREQGLQLPLMRLLMARGGVVQARAIHITLGHAIREPVVMLIDEGHLPLTAPTAAGLGRLDDLVRLLAGADPGELHAALSLAVINRQVECAACCLDAGADVNAFMIVHSHSTPLHQAAINADVPMLELLLARGARRDITDTLWQATPRGWALHAGRDDIAQMLSA